MGISVPWYWVFLVFVTTGAVVVGVILMAFAPRFGRQHAGKLEGTGFRLLVAGAAGLAITSVLALIFSS